MEGARGIVGAAVAGAVWRCGGGAAAHLVDFDAEQSDEGEGAAGEGKPLVGAEPAAAGPAARDPPEARHCSGEGEEECEGEGGEGGVEEEEEVETAARRRHACQAQGEA